MTIGPLRLFDVFQRSSIIPFMFCYFVPDNIICSICTYNRFKKRFDVQTITHHSTTCDEVCTRLYILTVLNIKILTVDWIPVKLWQLYLLLYLIVTVCPLVSVTTILVQIAFENLFLNSELGSAIRSVHWQFLCDKQARLFNGFGHGGVL